MNTQIIAIANQKGGVGKTTTCANLGIGLAQAGKKVLLIDGDPQGSLTISLGNPQPDKLPFTLSDAMGRILMDEPLRPGEGILHHPEGVDLMPADIQLSGMEVSLVNAMSRETILRQYLDTLKGQYSHILIDCQPSLGMLTVNALAAANRIIIPVQAEYLPAKGLEQLLSTVNKVKRQINPKLQIDGILLTMVDSRTNFAKEISALLRETYGSKIKVFGTEIPHSVRAKEISAEGKSIFAHDPGGKVAEGYRNLTKEVLKLVCLQPFPNVVVYAEIDIPALVVQLPHGEAGYVAAEMLQDNLHSVRVALCRYHNDRIGNKGIFRVAGFVTIRPIHQHFPPDIFLISQKSLSACTVSCFSTY